MTDQRAVQEHIHFATPPHPVNSEANLKPFSIQVPEENVVALKRLLELSRLPIPSWESSERSPYFGVSREWMTNATNQWLNDYNWREWEAKFNDLPQYTIDVLDNDQTHTVHFMALFSPDPSSIPIVLLHGWPGSVFEFLPLLRHLRATYSTRPDALKYHIVVPHLIGFGLSSPPPLDRDFTWNDNARIISKMMHLLGFGQTGYVAQGGDLGSAVATAIAAYDSACRLVHVNMFVIPVPKGVDLEDDIAKGVYRDAEVWALKGGSDIRSSGFAYAELQATRPSTAGFVIGSNPVSLLAWIAEKMMEWSDEQVPLPLEHILTNVSLYWFSGCYPTSQWCYRMTRREGGVDTASWLADVQVPVGYSWFEKERAMAPKKWIDTLDKIKWYRTNEHGGHFAALEQHEAFWDHVTDFVSSFWERL